MTNNRQPKNDASQQQPLPQHNPEWIRAYDVRRARKIGKIYPSR